MTDKVLIAGVGNSPFGKLTGRTPLDLEVEAAVKAMEDAGLNPQDVDGLVTDPLRFSARSRYRGRSMGH